MPRTIAGRSDAENNHPEEIFPRTLFAIIGMVGVLLVLSMFLHVIYDLGSMGAWVIVAQRRMGGERSTIFLATRPCFISFLVRAFDNEPDYSWGSSTINLTILDTL
jgi:hypothetical protein